MIFRLAAGYLPHMVVAIMVLVVVVVAVVVVEVRVTALVDVAAEGPFPSEKWRVPLGRSSATCRSICWNVVYHASVYANLFARCNIVRPPMNIVT